MLQLLKGELSCAERSLLVGMQVPSHEIEEWQAFLDALGDRLAVDCRRSDLLGNSTCPIAPASTYQN